MAEKNFHVLCNIGFLPNSYLYLRDCICILQIITQVIKHPSYREWIRSEPDRTTINLCVVLVIECVLCSCLTRLILTSPSSVVFLCFGSRGSFDEMQVKEIAYALEKSGHHFVWSLRRPPSDQISNALGDYEDPRAILPEGFLERTAGIGKVIGWAPQVTLLAHRAVGGFISHCGWNSLLESLWFGVPLATWPIYAEQKLNAFEMVVELGLAVEIKLDYEKDLFYPKADTVIVIAVEIENGI